MKTLTRFVNKKFFLGAMAIVALFAVVGVNTVSAAYTHTTTLRYGSTGSQVLSLQKALNSHGFIVASVGAGSPGMETMYFGQLTKNAVMAFQKAKGLSMVDGIVGHQTGTALAANTGGGVSTGVPLCPNGNTTASNCTMAPGGSVPLCPNGMTLASNCTLSPGGSNNNNNNGSLGNDDGDITGVAEISTDDSSAPEGETSEVFGFEFDVEGDVSVDRVDFYMEVDNSTTASDNPDDYFSSAILMIDGDEVAELDVEDWDQDDYGVVANGGTDDDEYRLRFSGLDEVFDDGDNPKFTLAFVTNSSIDSDDLSGNWTVELENDSIRFVDGRGFSSEEGASLTETFGLDEEETGDLRIRASADDFESTTIEVSDEDETEKVPVFRFELEEENGVDLTVNDLRVTITTGAVSGTTDESAVVAEAFLYHGSTELGSESVPAGGVVTFEDIDLQIDADDTVELEVRLTFADANDFTTGTSVSVAITSADITDAEDDNGNDEGDMDINGSATSETHQLASEGLMVVFDESSYTKTSSDTAGVNETVEFTLEFDITAFGEDIWVEKTCIDSATPGSNTTDVVVSLDGDANGDNTTCTNLDSTGDEGTFGFQVEEGQTEHFTVTILGNGGEAGGAGNSVTFRARLESIGYNIGADAAGDLQYAFDLEDFKSAAVTVFDR